MKPLSAYNKDKSRPYGRCYQCKKCKAGEAVGRQKADAARYQHRYFEQNITKFGITKDDYDRMFLEQQGQCAICGQPERTPSSTGGRRRLCIDHDHKTNLVRGLLCMQCNRGLGYFGDRPDLLLAAIEYLTKKRPRLGIVEA